MKNVSLVSQQTADSAETVAAVDQKTSAYERIKSHFTVQNIAVISILSAISFVLYMWVKFPLPFLFPAFLDMQISDLPALLGGFALGPVEGCFIIIVKCCIKMPFSSTSCVGELGDLIIGIANVLPAALIYRFHKNKKGAIVGLIAGTLCAVAASLLMNWLILIPFYAKAYGMDAVVGMMAELYPNITAENLYNYYLPAAVLPFNVLRCLVCALVTFFTYKPLSRALHWEIRTKAQTVDNVQPEQTPTDSAEAEQSGSNEDTRLSTLQSEPAQDKSSADVPDGHPTDI